MNAKSLRETGKALSDVDWNPHIPSMEFTDSAPAGQRASALKGQGQGSQSLIFCHGHWGLCWDAQQGCVIIMQLCLCRHFPLGNCLENTNLFHRKYQLEINYHHLALAICIFRWTKDQIFREGLDISLILKNSFWF